MMERMDQAVPPQAGGGDGIGGAGPSLATSTSNFVIPNVIVDRKLRKSYSRGPFLGKGNFGYCFKVTNLETKELFACKIVHMKKVIECNQKDAINNEINTHRDLIHKNIVKFHFAFEEKDNIYMILELCCNKSLADMLLTRHKISENEARFFVEQILQGLAYLHAPGRQIVHRDLKPENIYLGQNLEIKIGDFGCCTTEMIEKIPINPKLKKIIPWGTPIYVPPEITPKFRKAHTCLYDIWAVGIIFYRMMVGRVPFERPEGPGSRRLLFDKVCSGKYVVPAGTMTLGAKEFLASMLQVEPSSRPTAQELLNSNYLKKRYIPKCLPISALTSKPTTLELHALDEEKENANPVPLIMSVEIKTNALTPVLPEPLHAEEQISQEIENESMGRKRNAKRKVKKHLPNSLLNCFMILCSFIIIFCVSGVS